MRSEPWQQRGLALAIAIVVLGTGALAQAQTKKREDKAADDARAAVVEVEADLDAEADDKDAPAHKKAERKKTHVIELRPGRRERIEVKLPDPSWWIGLQCNPVDETLKAQLGREHGLAVEDIVAEGPAAKAGVQKHDVLVKIGDHPLAKTEDLVAGVQKSEGKEVSLLVIRAGKELTLRVTPAKREGDARLRILPPRVAEADRDVILRWLDREGDELDLEEDLAKRLEARPRIHMRRIMPGLVVGGPGARPLPKNLTVSVSRTGDEPAKITVTRGDDKWEIGDKELDKLPDDVRPHVAAMLGHAADDILYHAEGPTPDPVRTRKLPDGLEHRLEELTKRIEKLQKTVDGLRGSADQKK